MTKSLFFLFLEIFVFTLYLIPSGSVMMISKTLASKAAILIVEETIGEFSVIFLITFFPGWG